MRTKNIILALCIGITLFSCQKASHKEAASDQLNITSPEIDPKTTPNNEPSELVSSSAAVETKSDTNRKFIRTSELKFKVKNVIKSTYDIEDITNRQGGFVTYTNLVSRITNVSTIAVSADSSVEATNFEVANTMTLRVPNTKLDTTLKEISKIIDFLDNRIIKADDIILQLLENKLTQNRTENTKKRLTNAIDKRGKKLNETTSAEEILLTKQEQSDTAKISNLYLRDQINYSTISIEIYQRESVKRELVPNNKNIDAYKPSFGSKIFKSFKKGWNILEAFLVFISQLWGLLVLGGAIFVIYQLYKLKFQK